MFLFSQFFTLPNTNIRPKRFLLGIGGCKIPHTHMWLECEELCEEFIINFQANIFLLSSMLVSSNQY